MKQKLYSITGADDVWGAVKADDYLPGEQVNKNSTFYETATFGKVATSQSFHKTVTSVFDKSSAANMTVDSSSKNK